MTGVRLPAVQDIFICFEVVTAVVMNGHVFWDIMPWNPSEVKSTFRTNMSTYSSETLADFQSTSRCCAPEYRTLQKFLGSSPHQHRLWTHTDHWLVVTQEPICGVKTDEAWSWTFTSVYCRSYECVKLYPHGVMFNAKQYNIPEIYFILLNLIPY
jgi:hypothetical protein